MNFKTIASTALLVTTLPSCVMYTGVKDEPREAVRFATPRAAQVFYDAYLGPVRKRSISVSVGLPYAYRVVPSDNVTFNAAVASADTDHNHAISEKEANTFAASPAAGLRQKENAF